MVGVACGGAPLYYHCNWDAEQLVKRNVGRPIDIDGGISTTREIKRLSIVDDYGSHYQIYSGVVFGVANAFGQQENFVAWYKAKVEDGECTTIRLDHVAEWD